MNAFNRDIPVEGATVILRAISGEGNVEEEFTVTTGPTGATDQVTLLDNYVYEIIVIADDYENLTSSFNTTNGPNFQFNLTHEGISNDFSCKTNSFENFSKNILS